MNGGEIQGDLSCIRRFIVLLVEDCNFLSLQARNSICKSCGGPSIHIIFRHVIFSRKIKKLDSIDGIILIGFFILFILLPFLWTYLISNLLVLILYCWILILTFFLGIYFQYLRTKQIKLHL